MTREEAKEAIKEAYGNSEYTDEIIKTLQQEPILDKIRAEIKDWQTDIHDNGYHAEAHDFVFERIYEIIDEYVSESEG